MAGRKVIRTPEADAQWKEKLRSFSMKVGFHMSLSRSMLEMLCAVADDVMWDRALYFRDLSCPENWIASTRSLEKRGLIRRKSDDERKKVFDRASKVAMSEHMKHGDCQFYEHCFWELTPAGKCVVTLLKQAGMFIEADAAINKKARRA